MNRHKKEERAVDAVLARRFIPLHEEEFARLIAAGTLDARDCPVLAVRESSRQALSVAARGRDYGVVGLLELTPNGAADGFVYAWDAVSFVVESDDLAVEVTSRLGLYPDLVVDAIPVHVDPHVFRAEGSDGGAASSEQAEQTLRPEALSEAPIQLDLVGEARTSEEEQDASDSGDEDLIRVATSDMPLVLQAGLGDAEADAGDGQASESVDDLWLGMLNRIAGATCLIRHRVMELGLPGSELARLLPRSAEGATGSVQSFVELVLMRVQESLAGGEFAPGELAVLTDAATLLEDPDVGRGIDPREFTARLIELAARGGEDQLGLAEKLSQTVGKLLDSEIELTSARIDDSKQVGLRGLMVFLQTLEPENLNRWLGARSDVGRGVSLIASLYAGIYGGIAILPREVKGRGRQAFIGPIWYARQFLGGTVDLAAARSWAPDASCQEVVQASGWTIYESTAPAKPEIVAMINAVRDAGFQAQVDPDSGELTIPLALESGPATAKLVVGPSRWFPGMEVARLQVGLVRSGRGKPTKPLLEAALSESIAPAGITLDPSSGEFSLFIEVTFGQKDQGGQIASSLELLTERIEGLGLVPRRVQASAKSTRVRRVSKKTG